MYYYTFLNENPLQRYTFFDICKRPRIFFLNFFAVSVVDSRCRRAVTSFHDVLFLFFIVRGSFVH